GATDASLRELGQVAEVERGDRGRDAVGRQPGQAAALDGQLDEPQALEDLQGEAGVVAVVLGEAGPVRLEPAEDLLGAVGPGRGLALAEHLARDGVEAVVVHPYEGAAEHED